MSDFLSLSDRLSNKLVAYYKKQRGNVKDVKDLEVYYNALSTVKNLEKDGVNMVKAWKHVNSLDTKMKTEVLSNAIKRMSKGGNSIG